MARRKRDNSFDIAKAIAALIVLLAMFLSHKDFSNLLGTLWSITLVVLELAAMFAVVFFCIRFVANKQHSKSNPISDMELSPEDDLPFANRPSTDYAPKPVPQPAFFTIELVKSLEWRRFEILVQELFKAEGKYADRIRAGADGGVDLALREVADGPVTAIIQCKAWKTYKVGVKPVRELFGVMAADGVRDGIFVCCGVYTQEAIEWAKFKPMTLISGAELATRLNNLDSSSRCSLLQEITEGDYTTPTCPSCDVKMVRKKSALGEFWGCIRYPRCKSKLRGVKPL